MWADLRFLGSVRIHLAVDSDMGLGRSMLVFHLTLLLESEDGHIPTFWLLLYFLLWSHKADVLLSLHKLSLPRGRSWDPLSAWRLEQRPLRACALGLASAGWVS